MKMIPLIVIGALAVSFLLMYGALKIAEQIAKPHIDRIEALQ